MNIYLSIEQQQTPTTMSVKTYSRTFDGDTLELRMDLVQASDTISFRWNGEGPDGTGEDDDFHGSPFQVASASHNVDEAFDLIRNWKG